MKSIKDLRTDYQKSELNVKDLTEEPIILFQQWLTQAIAYSDDANAFIYSLSILHDHEYDVFCYGL